MEWYASGCEKLDRVHKFPYPVSAPALTANVERYLATTNFRNHRNSPSVSTWSRQKGSITLGAGSLTGQTSTFRQAGSNADRLTAWRPSEFLVPVSERMLLAKFCEKDRKEKISIGPDFTGTGQNWPMPLILQGKGFPQIFLSFQLLRWSLPLTSVHLWSIFPLISFRVFAQNRRDQLWQTGEHSLI